MGPRHIIQQGGVTVGDEIVKLAAEPNLEAELPLTHYNSEFLGTFERDGRICDYFLAFTTAGVFYYYVPRDEAGQDG